MEKKMTKKEMFAMIMALDEVQANEEMVNFIQHEIDLLDKKSASKSKKSVEKSTEDERLKDIIFSVLTSDGMTSTEVWRSSTEFADLSGQKITYLLNAMVKDNKIGKKKDKKSTLFCL